MLRLGPQRGRRHFGSGKRDLALTSAGPLILLCHGGWGAGRVAGRPVWYPKPKSHSCVCVCVCVRAFARARVLRCASCSSQFRAKGLQGPAPLPRTPPPPSAPARCHLLRSHGGGGVGTRLTLKATS